MIIRLTRGKDDKTTTLTCIRDDKTVTYQSNLEFFARHDLLHYAVETTLGYDDAFFGMVAAGRDIDDFGTQGGVKDTYTTREIWTEFIVALMQWGVDAHQAPASEAALVAQLERDCTDRGLPSPGVSVEQIGRIRRLADTLHRNWDRLVPGDTLTLPFLV